VGKLALFVALVALQGALGLQTEVELLASDEILGPYTLDGGAGTHPASTKGGEGAGYMTSQNNFAGPKYGLPGYKESHAWETGTDLFNPAVWNMEYFAAKYSLPLDQATCQKKWLEMLAAATPGTCPEGRIDWSLNKYATNNPPAALTKDKDMKDVPASCTMVLENFLSSGIYAGFTGLTGFDIKKVVPGQAVKSNLPRFPVQAGLADLSGQDPGLKKSEMKPTLTYSYTFWMKVSRRDAGKTNIMAFNTDDGTKLPTFSLDMRPGVTDVEFSVQQSDNPTQSCTAVGTGFTDAKPGFLVLGKWYQVALVVQKFHSKSSKQILYLDGVKACEKDNASGTTVDPEDNGLLWMSAPGSAPAAAEIALLKFYPGRAITAVDVAVQKKLEEKDPVLSGPPDGNP
jgi:hypothetical protein